MKTDYYRWVLIQRHLTGNAGPEDRRKLQGWMERDSANRELVREVEQIWKMTPEEDFDLNVQITIKDTELLEVPFTSTFQNAKLDEILSVIAVSMEIEYLREGSEIEFH